MTLNLHNFGLLWPLGMFDHSFESSINPLQDYDTLWPGDQNNWQFNQGGKILSNLSKQNIVSRRDDEEESQTAQLQVRDSDLVDAKLSYNAKQHGLCLYLFMP